MRILFFATADIATETLRTLATDKRFDIVGVVTKPDAPHGRHQEITPSAIATLALSLHLPLFRFAKLKDVDAQNTLAKLEADVSLVFAYGKIIPQNILDIPKQGTLNIHPSLLPKYRGPSPLQAAIDSGDAETGITLMKLDAEMDHGDIIEQIHLPLTEDTTTTSLHDHVKNLVATWVPNILLSYHLGGYKPTPQHHDAATYCSMLTRENGALDWTQSAEILHRRIRAYAGWPGTWTVWQSEEGKKRVKIAPEDVLGVDVSKEAPGALTPVQNGVSVACGNGTSLLLSAVHIEGKEHLTITELLHGMPDFFQGTFVAPVSPSQAVTQ